MPDAIAPWPSQRLRWALDYVVALFDGPVDRLADVIARLELAPFLDARIGTLSKGQRKRAALAIGLLTAQPLLLAGEPFDGLDLAPGAAHSGRRPFAERRAHNRAGCGTAAIAEHPSTAAILTLSVTVGTWILNFAAAVHGGMWERAAAYTPTAMVAEFQHGLVRASVIVRRVLRTDEPALW